MNAVLRNCQLSAAASAYDNACDCCGPDAIHGERIAALITQYKADPAKRAEADSWTDGSQSGEHYSELESAMADLHFTDPSDLLGSDVLVRLYRLAKVHGEARLSQFEEMAERELAA